MLFDYKTTKMRFQKTFLLRCVTICAKIGLCGFMSQAIISYIEGLSQNFLSKYLLKISKLGKLSYFVIWLTLWHYGTQVMSLNLTWTTWNCFLVWLPTQIGLFNPLFWRKNKCWCEHSVFWLLQDQFKSFCKLQECKSWLRRGRKKNFLHDLLWILIILEVK